MNDKKLENVNSIEELPKIIVDKDSEILIGMTIDGEEIFTEIGINRVEAMNLLKSIGYGTIGWEKYNIVGKE